MYVRIASTMPVVHRLVGFVGVYSLRKGTAFLRNMQVFLEKNNNLQVDSHYTDPAWDDTTHWETTNISFIACIYANNCRKSIRRKVSQSNPSAPITKERKG